MLTVDDIDLIIVIVLDTLEEILQRSEAKQEMMFQRIEAELKGVQQDLYSICVYCTVVSRGHRIMR
jgi:hypothetical protein